MEIYRQCGESSRFSHKRCTRSKFEEFTVAGEAELSQRNTDSYSQRQDHITLDECDPEVPTQVIACVSEVTTPEGLGSARASRFSNWWSLIRSLANLIVKIREFKKRKSDPATNEAVKRPGDGANKPTHLQKPISLLRLPSVAEFNQASGVIIRAVQEESFPKELKTLKGADQNCSFDERHNERAKKELTKTFQLYRLNPFIDEDGVLRVEGRLRYSSLDGSEKHPIVLPKGHHVSVLLIKHYHAKVCHQG